MNGIDEIIARIEAEAKASEISLRAEFEKNKNQIETSRDEAVAEFNRRADEAVAANRKASGERAQARASTARRDVLLAEKGKLTESVLARAAAAFEVMPKAEYLSVIGKLLKEAVGDESLAGEKITLTVPEKAPASGEELCGFSKITPDKLVKSPKIKAGFILTTERVELCCTPEKLIAARRAELIPLVTGILFG